MRWQRNGIDITNGTVAVLRIQGIQPSDRGEFRALFSTACGTAATGPAHVVVPCPADFNTDGQLDFFDYLDFAQTFDEDDPAADFDANGQLDFFDYLDFVRAFGAGCG